jgi:antitoxin HicB
MSDHRVIVRQLSAEDGGGFLASVPDLPGCVSDGEMQDEAITNVRAAIEEWKDQCRAMGRPVPEPSPQD